MYKPVRYAILNGFTHTSLPTRPHRWLVAGRDTHIHPCLQYRTDGWSPAETLPAYKTAQMAGRRQRHTHTSLPTRPHRWLVASRDTPCLQDRTDGWSPAETHTHIPAYKTAQMAGRQQRHSLPTRPHRWLVAGRDTHTHPCLQDHTDGWSPAETHTYIPAYKTTQMAGRQQRHTHTFLPTRPHRWLVAGRDTQNRYECLSAGTVSMMYNYTSEAEGNCTGVWL